MYFAQLSQWLPFVLFAFVASITPGPTNLLIFSNSARFGWSAALPIMFGGCAAAAVLVLAVGSGLGEVLASLPRVQQAMSLLGVLWLSWLAWQIFRSPPADLERDTNAARLGALGAAALQLVNPKTWMMALAVISVYAGHGVDRLDRVQLLSLLFFLVSIPCTAVWAGLGIGSQRLLSATQMQRLNQLMAVLLLVSAWAGALL
ncbi:LysE family translocator [Pseudomonas sp. GD04087]|uniref:LysE family translocator n=1 Tax=unclassified Pseudomonas TaxID=196821 RepID=UPI002448E29D|nr:MULTISPECIES: LysE family translocator [unclassified Pseudomonas]MDH0290337.1 LysE family translocator [Pseudomonas sp. GD04087]MDH1047458.1 LysE family translocator [Pseudomonas sp. GD03903]MDH2000235.1 LysE family translocator [Pseudomonas sp. GD03691]